MSFLGTLAKVAVGIAVAKGVSGLAKGGLGGGRSSRGSAPEPGGPGSGGVFGGTKSPGGGLGEVLAGRGTAGGGLGGLLEGLSKASRPEQAKATQPEGGSMGDLLNQSLERFGEPESKPSPSQEDAARLMLRAMLQAAKSDGKIDEAEKKKLFGQLGDIDRDEMAFINAELEKSVDVAALAREVPQGMGPQVYLMSLMGIDLDNQAEAQYLHKLATALSIGPQEANTIHNRLGVSTIYR